MIRAWFASIVLLATLFCGPPAAAHLTPNSEINLDFGRETVRADVIIPLGDYAAASENPVDRSPASLVRGAEYLRRQVRITTSTGEPWRMSVDRVEFAQIAGPPDLHAILTLTPPVGRSARNLVIDWHAVVDAVPGHFAIFVARSDFSAGQLSEQRQILGAVRVDQNRLAIDRGAVSYLSGFRAAMALGAHHIAEGHDHLLFLITLLIPAPLLAVGRRWTGPLLPSRALWRLTWIVTAFTIGHSTTLLGGVLLGWHLPSRLVEIVIAASILISAIHAWRPIFPGREAWIAGTFGLVHGLAFATLAGGFGVGLTERVLATLGFNIGVELIQLVVVAAVMPMLFMLAAFPLYSWVRAVLASFAGLAALAWMVERFTGQSNAVAMLTNALLAFVPWFVAAATLAAIAISLHSRKRRRERRAED